MYSWAVNTTVYMTEEGHHVLFPYGPFLWGFVYYDEKVFKTAKRRFALILISLISSYLVFYFSFKNASWFEEIFYQSLLFLMFGGNILVFLSLPKKVLYRKKLHGPVVYKEPEDPNKEEADW